MPKSMISFGFSFLFLVANADLAHPAPKEACDITVPSPQKLCADHYAGAPAYIQSCIREEVEGMMYLSENIKLFSDVDADDCIYAGCRAGYQKIKTVSECLRAINKNNKK